MRDRFAVVAGSLVALSIILAISSLSLTPQSVFKAPIQRINEAHSFYPCQGFHCAVHRFAHSENIEDHRNPITVILEELDQ